MPVPVMQRRGLGAVTVADWATGVFGGCVLRCRGESRLMMDGWDAWWGASNGPTYGRGLSGLDRTPEDRAKVVKSSKWACLPLRAADRRRAGAKLTPLC